MSAPRIASASTAAQVESVMSLIATSAAPNTSAISRGLQSRIVTLKPPAAIAASGTPSITVIPKSPQLRARAISMAETSSTAEPMTVAALIIEPDSTTAAGAATGTVPRTRAIRIAATETLTTAIATLQTAQAIATTITAADSIV